jgi:crossover junction endodeoxyribonuclease RuvC
MDEPLPLSKQTLPTRAPDAPIRRILGLDPGLRVTGFGIIESHARALTYVASGCIRSPDGAPLPVRLKVLFDGVLALLNEHAPHEVAVENVFVNVNPQSTLLLGQARGALLCAAMGTGKPLAEYTALQIKKAVVGHGKADKKQVSYMVCRLLALSASPASDAADALACAICHAHQPAIPLSGLKRL